MRWRNAQARTLGPWASARQLAEGRAGAAAAREGKIAAAKQSAAEADAAAEWEPKKDAPARKQHARAEERVGKLYGMCLALLVEHIDDVETLWGLPVLIKVRPQLRPSRRECAHACTVIGSTHCRYRACAAGAVRLCLLDLVHPRCMCLQCLVVHAHQPMGRSSPFFILAGYTRGMMCIGLYEWVLLGVALDT